MVIVVVVKVSTMVVIVVVVKVNYSGNIIEHCHFMRITTLLITIWSKVSVDTSRVTFNIGICPHTHIIVRESQ